MQAISEESQERDSMTTYRSSKLASLFIGTLLCAVCSSCDPQIEDGIPLAFVEIDINLNQSDYFELRRDGGYVYILGGVKGIILYRESPDVYRALERNSPVNPSQACAIVDVDQSGLFIVDPCSGATFDFDGLPSNGISRFPLRIYSTTLENNWLYIRSG